MVWLVCWAGVATTPASPPDICLQPALRTEPPQPRCLGFFPRFTFNAARGVCESFSYGGCGATENLFLSESECEDRCLSVSVPGQVPAFWSQTAEQAAPVESDENICDLPPIMPGPMGCLGFARKWTHSRAEGACVPYVYGGCRGTENLFDSEAECEARCPGRAGSPAAAACHLPLSVGPCKAMQPSYGFSRESGRCEQFLYGGCGGNANRFASLEDCVGVCGGGEPQPSLADCSSVQCDKGAGQVGRARGCRPVTEGHCCPVRWDCTEWERRLANTSQCFHAGQFYQPGEEVRAADQACQQSCFCTTNHRGNAEITCASVDCGMTPGFSWDNCRPTYSSLDQCCMPDWTCGPELEALPTCQLEDKTYRHGEMMYPAQDSCSVCLCQSGWDGDIHGEFCHQVNCGLELAGDRLLRGCQPIYKEGVCCPVDWTCPDEPPVPELPPAVTGRTALRSSDRCLLPRDPGPCKMLAPPTFYFDISSRTCRELGWGGCKGNQNNFPAQKECEETCKEFSLVGERSRVQERCQQPRQPGRCRGFQKKYFHNKDTEECEEFVYTGCGGNENNYDSQDECEAVCGVERGGRPGRHPRCNKPVTTGNCRSRLQMFYYDQASGLCRQFYYSGCGAGPNMFPSQAACAEACVEEVLTARASLTQDLHVAPACLQEKMVGPCRAISARWFWDSVTRSCRQFQYGGCLGNDNNFATEEACRNNCGQGSAAPRHLNISPFALANPASPPFSTLPERVPGRPAGSAGPVAACPGCPVVSPISPEIKRVAAHATKQLDRFATVTGEECQHVRLNRYTEVI